MGDLSSLVDVAQPVAGPRAPVVLQGRALNAALHVNKKQTPNKTVIEWPDKDIFRSIETPQEGSYGSAETLRGSHRGSSIAFKFSGRSGKTSCSIWAWKMYRKMTHYEINDVTAEPLKKPCHRLRESSHWITQPRTRFFDTSQEKEE